MLSTATANSDDIMRLDFSDIGNLAFSKPVCLNYKDHTFTNFNSWASLYAKVAFLLKQDYPQIIDRIEVSHTDKKSKTREITMLKCFLNSEGLKPSLFFSVKKTLSFCGAAEKLGGIWCEMG